MSHPVPSALRIHGSSLLPALKLSQLAAGPFHIVPFFSGIPPPADIKQSDSAEAFKSELKTHIFTLTFDYVYHSIPHALHLLLLSFQGTVSVSMNISTVYSPCLSWP